MHPAITALKNALGYAKIADPEVHDATHKLIDELGFDLEQAEYEAGAPVETAISSLEEALNNVDSDSEDLDESIRKSRDAGDVVEDDDEEEVKK